MTQLVKLLFVTVLLMSVTLAAVTISTDKAVYNCNFNSCELVNIEIQTTEAPLGEQVYLTIDYDNSDGEITKIVNFRKQGSKRKYEINSPFDLPNGKKYYNMKFNAYGSGKFNISIIGADTGTVYALLDPWWNSSFNYRNTFNLTTSGGVLTNYPVLIVLNSTNINFSNTNDDGSDLRFTWLNGSTDQEIDFAILPDWNENNNSLVLINATMINSSDNQYAYYWSNTTPVSSKSNLTKLYFNNTNFNDETMGVFTGDGVVQNSTYKEGGEALKIISTNISANYANTSDNTFFYGDNKTIYAWIYPSFNVTNDGFASLSVWQDSKAISVVGISANGSFIYSDNISDQNYFGSSNNNEWYLIKLDLDNVSRQFGFQIYDSNNLLVGSRINLGMWDAPTAFDGTTLYMSGAASGDGYYDNVFNTKFSNLTITQTFGQIQGIRAIFNTPTEGQEVLSPNVILNFTVTDSGNYSIYVDDIFNKTVEITTSSYQEVFSLLEGDHNFTVNDNQFDINSTVSFSVVSFVFESTTFDTNVYELNLMNISTIIVNNLNSFLTNASINYNGTITEMDLINLNSTHDLASVRLSAPFVDVGSSLPINFNITIRSNNSNNFTSSNFSQTIDIAYFINSIQTQLIGIEGGLVTQNVTITDLADVAIVTLFMNNSEIGNIEGFYLSGTTNQSWEIDFNLPNTLITRNITLQNYVKVEYSGVIAYRFFNDTNITIFPINIGTCAGNRTFVVFNYSAWDEANESTQISTGNYWETKLDITAPNGTIVTQIGVTGTAAIHQICIEPNVTYVINASTFITNNFTNQYIKRSHFFINYINSNITEQVKIFLLNASITSTIDFFVKDVFDSFKQNRIIHVYKYYANSNEFEELFNLLTDSDGKAVGYIKAFDAWYKIVVTDANGRITATIDSTQFSTDTYTIVEGTGVAAGEVFDINHDPQWNNATKIFQVSVNSGSTKTYRLTLSELTYLGNITYCQTTVTGVTEIMYCDLSNSTVSEFKWELEFQMTDVNGNTFWYQIASDIVQAPVTPIYGVMGLILTGLLLIFGGTLFFWDIRIGIIVEMLILTVTRVFGLYFVGYDAIIGMWFVAFVILFILRGEK